MAVRPKVGYAVVGLGLIAQNSILPAFANTKRAKLVGIVSRDLRKASRFAEQYRVKAYRADDYSKCLADPNVTAIYVATPPGAHEEAVLAAAAAHKHVLCEKPLAASVEQAARMVESCRRHGVLLMTAYRKYFEPSTIYFRNLIRKGAFGQIDVLHTAFSEVFSPGTSPAWLLDPKLAGGGPLMDLGIYCVNTTRWLLGEDPLKVSAHSWRNNVDHFREVEEGIQFRMSFPSGSVVQASSTYASLLSSFISIQGSKGWAILAPAFPFDQKRHLSGVADGRRFERSFDVIDEFALEMDAFSAAIQSGGSIEPDGAQGKRDLEIIRAVYDAAEAEREVEIRYDA